MLNAMKKGAKDMNHVKQTKIKTVQKRSRKTLKEANKSPRVLCMIAQYANEQAAKQRDASNAYSQTNS